MPSDDFGDFQEVKREQGGHQGQQQGPFRVRMPRQGQMIGMIIRRLGGNKMEVIGSDGKTRNCRVPGRYKRRLWLRPNNFILIVPWEYDDNKADIIYKYSSSEVNQLKKRGMLSSMTEEF